MNKSILWPLQRTLVVLLVIGMGIFGYIGFQQHVLPTEEIILWGEIEGDEIEMPPEETSSITEEIDGEEIETIETEEDTGEEVAIVETEEDEESEDTVLDETETIDKETNGDTEIWTEENSDIEEDSSQTENSAWTEDELWVSDDSNDWSEVDIEEEATILEELTSMLSIPYACDQEDITVGKYTIQACNVGSTIAGTGPDSYGYHFQRGNNYGFSGTVGTDFPASTSTADASMYGPTNPYSSNTWIKVSPWDSSNNMNLWWWSGDTLLVSNGEDTTDRQGPCTTWYHIPAISERNDVYNEGKTLWYRNSLNDIVVFADYLQLPLAGMQQNKQNNLSYTVDFGYYRSSSPNTLTNAYNLYLNNATGSSISLKDSRIYGHGLSVRCLKDTLNDAEPPIVETTGTITYSTTVNTYSAVLATLHFNTTGVTIDNNGGKNTYLFKQNGSFTFFFHDQGGTTGEITAEVSRILNEEWNYGGTGIIQTFVAPHDGEYMLEARGAKGGNGANGAYAGGNWGKGGYASGIVTLSAGDTLNFVAGTRGQDGSPRISNGICPGGAGGFGAGGGAGGARCSSYSNAWWWGGGWGMSVIRNASNTTLLIAWWWGGGGWGSNNPGGCHGNGGNWWAGGGLVGSNGGSSDSGTCSNYGMGASQSAGGNWGGWNAGGHLYGWGGVGCSSTAQNGNAITFIGGDGKPGCDSSSAGGSAGGGWWYYGWWGGGSYASAGGWGSSYVWGVQDWVTIAGNATMPDPQWGTMVWNANDGYVKITALTSPNWSVRYSPKQPTTWSVTVSVERYIDGTFTFTTSGRTTSDGGITYTKTYDDNFIGEIVYFTDEEESVEIKEIEVTRIMPEVIISYNPEGPALTIGNVISTITFTGKVSPSLVITNNGGSADRTFSKNGNFTYTYNNGWGTIGSAMATVEWINSRPGFKPFITTWRTTSAGEILTIPLNNGIIYDFDIDWWDGMFDSYKGAGLSTINHTYDTAGDHQISIRGIFPHIYLGQNSSYGQKLLSVDQWGDVQWSSMHAAFSHAYNLSILAEDTPNLSKVTDMSQMFYSAINLTGNFNNWNTSKVQNMQYLFAYANNFDSPLANWKLTKVRDLQYMFQGTYIFNQDLSSWDLSGATNLSYMFQDAQGFNGSLSGWDTHTVTSMQWMFQNAINFNQPIHHFNTSKVIDMYAMFQYAITFNQSLHWWDTSKVQNMGYMFYYATDFNQDLSTRKVTGINWTNNMHNMFYSAALTTYNYNQLLSGWSTQNVMKSMNLGTVGPNMSPTKYGGCMMNGLAGIAGHNSLTTSKNWILTDGGLDSCAITGNITYNPAGPLPSYGTVLATLTLNQTGIVLSTWWTATGDIDAFGWSLIWEKEYIRNIPGEIVAFQNEYGYTGSALLKITRLVTTYPWCDTPDLVFGDFVISACNVGSTTAGIGVASEGTYFDATDAPAVCAAGYHVPSKTEWLALIQEGYTRGLWDGTRWIDWLGNGQQIVVGLNWTATDQSVFQNMFLLPGYNGLPPLKYWTKNAKVFVADDTMGTVDEISDYSSDTLPVRCFQDSSKPISDVWGGSTGTGTENNFTYQGSCQPYLVPRTAEYLLEVWGAAGGPRYLGYYPGNYRWWYAKGKVTLSAWETVYVCVGGQGNNTYGGFNGWGNSIHTSLDDNDAGGGATDIRLIGGARNNNAGLLSRIIVAGGGWWGRGSAIETNAGTESGIGGRQDSSGGGSCAYPGWFGYGASYDRADDNPGGWWGWYGGCLQQDRYGGWGSNYVLTSTSYKPAGYTPGIKYYMKDTQTLAGNASMPNPAWGTMIGNATNGYAKITLLSLPLGNITYTPNTDTTGSVLVTVAMNETGTIHFTTAGRTTSDGGLTYTKTYTRNFSGEVISFIDEEGNKEVQEAAVTRIRPEVSIVYTPAEENGYTSGNVDATVSFSRPNITILNNGGSDTYTFTSNDEFIFIYQDERGFTGEAKAEVTRAKDLSSFITTWNIPYNGYTMTLRSNGSVGYDYDIDWGDGSPIEHKTTGNPAHTYAVAGDYQIKIRGKFWQLYPMSDYAMRQNLRSVDQWGKVQRQSFQYAFYNIYNLEILATDTPNFSGVTDVSYMFHYVYNLTGNFKNWNLDGVINAYAMFHSAHNFNSSVAGRNVSTIQNMNEMFAYAYIFDQDLSSWNPTDLMYASQILYYTSLSTRNYNELLASRAQQPLQDNVQLHHVGGYDGGATMYGGCGVANGPAGIAGHDTLAKEKGWYFYDGGAGICPPVPYSGQLVFTRKVGGGTYCINGIDGNEEGNTVIVDWGDGSAAIPTLDGSNLCHNYTKNATYAVRISSPEELTSLNLSSSYIKSLTLGDATNLVTLDLSNNQNPNIRNLLAGQTAKLAHLESINLSYNEITTLVPTMLSGLKNLMYFYCYGNKIQTIPNGFFASAPNLQYIDMNSNQIASLQSGAFAGLSALGHLYLHENQLHTITAGTFVGLSNLSTLHLGNNQLYTIETGAFTNAFQDRGRFYIENNNLKTLPASFPSEVGNIYIYSYNNCLDPTFMTAGVQSLLATYDRNWHNNQYLCTEVSYDPAKPASWTVVGPVEAAVEIYGSPNKKSTFLWANPTLETWYSFIDNGIYVFDYSSSSYSYYLKNKGTLAKVDRIAWNEYTGGDVQWTRFTNSPQEQRCVNFGGLGQFSSTIDWGDGTSESVLIRDMNFWGWTWKCHTYTSPGTFTVSLSEAYLLSHFESTRQNILSWTGDVTHLQYLNLNGNYLRDLPTTKLLYNDLTLFNTIEVTWNCIDPDVQDSNNADWIDGHHGNYRRDAQYLCAGVSYDPKKPVTGTVPGPVEATLDLYGPANQKSAFLANNPGFSFDHTFIRNGTYIFNFNNTDTSSTNLREWQIPARVTWIDVDPATIPMHWTWTATAGATKTIPYINTFEDIQIDWGDGSAVEMIFDGENDNLTHTYTTAGNYTVTILNPQPITELYLGISSLMAMAMGKDATANQNITDFRAGQAHNIQTLTLGNNQLSAFAEGALRGLGGVQIIDLGNNTFSSFNAEAIDELGSLFALVLSNNQLTTYPDIPFDKFQQLIITFDHNRLKTLPTEYAATIDPMYNTLYLAENCIDRTSEEEVVYGDILDYRDDNLGFPARWRDQHLCASVSYDPPEIDGITTGNVLASVIFNGPTVKKTDFFTANPGLETDHTFTQNGSYLFDYSSAIGATVLIDPVDGLLPATVTRIDKGMPEVISTIYVPSGIPGGPIVVTLIINKTVLPIPWWTGGTGTVFTKTYAANTSETVLFYDLLGNTGSTEIVVTQISSWVGWWSGGGKELTPDYCPNGDFSPSYYDGTCDENDQHGSAEEDIVDKNVANENKSEYESVYEWAYKNGLTSMDTYLKARMEDKITRAEVAKIISIYAEKFMDKKATLNPMCYRFKDLGDTNAELQGYVVKACNLGLMGYWSDGVHTKEYFSPNDTITRAEVGVLLSRLFRWNRYAGDENNWYQNHLEALQTEEVMYDISTPMMRELRGNFYLMLKRVAEK